MSRVPYLSARLQGFGTTVFAEMSARAVATGSVNLGQGFPDYPGPPEVLDVARAAIGTAADQYPPGDRKSTRLNSSHANISYAVFCLKKKKNQNVLNVSEVACIG